MLECTPLTCRARSSTAEQRPFKPLVESSNLSALTEEHPSRVFFVLAAADKCVGLPNTFTTETLSHRDLKTLSVSVSQW